MRGASRLAQDRGRGEVVREVGETLAAAAFSSLPQSAAQLRRERSERGVGWGRTRCTIRLGSPPPRSCAWGGMGIAGAAPIPARRQGLHDLGKHRQRLAAQESPPLTPINCIFTTRNLTLSATG